MMPYQAYQLYQIERPKSRAEIRAADEQLGRMAKSVTALRERMAQRVTARALSLRGFRRQPATAQQHTARA
jgi:hypothetical protein